MDMIVLQRNVLVLWSRAWCGVGKGPCDRIPLWFSGILSLEDGVCGVHSVHGRVMVVNSGFLP